MADDEEAQPTAQDAALVLLYREIEKNGKVVLSPFDFVNYEDNRARVTGIKVDYDAMTSSVVLSHVKAGDQH